MTDSPEKLVDRDVVQGVLVLTPLMDSIQSEDIAEALRRDFLTALNQSGTLRVVIDFRHTRFVSSIAFRPLLHLRKHLQPLGGRLVVCGLSPGVGEVFYATRMVNPSGQLGAPFELAANREAALTLLNPPPANP